MKRIAMLLSFAFLACLPPCHGAEDLQLGGLPQLIGQKLLEVKPAGLSDFHGNVGAGAYLPIWTLKYGETRYAEFLNVGYRGIVGSSPDAFFMPVAVNVPALSAWVWRSAWAQEHVERTFFPNTFLGIGVVSAMGAIPNLRWSNWKDWTAAVVSVRF